MTSVAKLPAHTAPTVVSLPSETPTGLPRRAVLGRLAGALALGAVANVTAIAITRSAPVTIPSADGESIEIAAELIEANLRENAARDVWKAAKKAMAAWQKSTPPPVMREIKEKNGTVQYEAWLKQLAEATDPSEQERLKRLDPNADLKAAMKEHAIRKVAWSKRRATAEAECGFYEAEEKWNAATSEVEEFCDALAETSMTTLDGLKIKCRAAVRNRNDDIAWSAVHDLLAIAEDQHHG
jgi:hypothetical protein